MLTISHSPAYNALFIFAVSLYLIDKGEVNKARDLIQQHRSVVDQLSAFSPFRLHVLRLLGEILIRQEKEEEAAILLKQLEPLGHALYKDRENTFYAHLDILKAQCLLKENHINEAETLLHQALNLYAESLGGDARHRKQAFAHFVLGTLYERAGNYEKALARYLKSESIYDTLLKEKAIEDVSLLYKHLALLGVALKDESLTHTYLKKHLKTFGLQHPRTQEIIHHLDRKGLMIPF